MAVHETGTAVNIRWRLGLAAIQLAILSGASWIAVGSAFPFSIWFVSGLLGVVLALQLTEPFFTRPTDVLVSAVSVVLLVLVADRSTLGIAWWGVLIYAATGGIVALFASVARRDTFDARGAELSFRAYQLMRAFAGKGLYSAVFVVAVLSEFGSNSFPIFILSAAWALIIALSTVRWDQLFTGRNSASKTFEVFALISPNRVALTGRSAVFTLGSEVEVRREGPSVRAHVVRRLVRRRNVLVELVFPTAASAESFLGHSVQIAVPTDSTLIVGTVAAETTDNTLVFYPLADLAVGSAVTALNAQSREVVHQVAELRVVQVAESTGGSELIVRAMALQVGEVSADGSVDLCRTIVQPGATVRPFAFGNVPGGSRTGQIHIGSVMGTDLPVSLSIEAIKKGHCAVLGMTGMGKSSFTKRLASKLGESCPVVVVDQTGEYRKMKLPLSSPSTASIPGVSLKEIPRNQAQYKEALASLDALSSLGRAEFDRGDEPMHRILIVEEAHQFVPEPSMLGFNSPGRDEAIQFGLQMMQVRKFGVSVILVSQRTAVVAKSALSQCENIIAFKSVDQTGLDYLGAMGGSSATHLLPRLRIGEAILMGPASSTQNAVGVQLLHEEPSPAAGGTPPPLPSTPTRSASAGDAPDETPPPL